MSRPNGPNQLGRGPLPGSGIPLDVRQQMQIREQMQQQVLSQLEARRVQIALNILSVDQEKSGITSEIHEKAVKIINEVLDGGAALLAGQQLLPSDDSNVALAS